MSLGLRSTFLVPYIVYFKHIDIIGLLRLKYDRVEKGIQYVLAFSKLLSLFF